jgi:PhnB protein
MQLNPHLNFNGQCEAAFRFYERCLGGRITAMASYESTPAGGQIPEHWRKKVMHAELVLGTQTLMGSDPPPDWYEAPKGFSLTVQTEQPEEAERVFQALAENGIVRQPLQPTFWAARFGMLVDQFGVPWMVNCAGAAAAQSH